MEFKIYNNNPPFSQRGTKLFLGVERWVLNVSETQNLYFRICKSN